MPLCNVLYLVDRQQETNINKEEYCQKNQLMLYHMKITLALPPPPPTPATPSPKCTYNIDFASGF